MRYLVESYLSAARRDEVPSVDARSRAATDELVRAGAGLRFVETIFVPDDEMCLLVFEADTPELVREASRRAGVACERVLEARTAGTGSTPPRGEQR